MRPQIRLLTRSSSAFFTFVGPIVSLGFIARAASRTLFLIAAVIWFTACSGSDSSTPQSTTSTSPSTQEPTKPPPTTQPPSMAPPSTQPPGSQPPASTPPGSVSGGAFTQGTGFNAIVRTVVMTQDGTQDLYVGGDFTTYNGTAANHLIRLHPDGSVAQTFGQGFDQVVLALGLASDGSNALYAGGFFKQFDGQAAPALIRLTATGLRDTTFQPTTLNFTPITIAVTDDGSKAVYAAGNIQEPVPGTPVTASTGRVAKFGPDGNPDPLFPINLRFPGPADENSPMVSCLAVPRGSGKVYVGGSMSVSFGGRPPGSLLRLNADGTVDATFATGTGVPGIIGTTAVEAIALAADGSGDVYAGGRITGYNGMPVTLGTIRVHDNGALDSIFAPSRPLVPFAIAPAQDGSGDVLVGGFSPGVNIALPLLRLARDGAAVSSFHEPTLDEEILTIVPVLDGTNDFYIGGLFTMYNGVPVNHIARIHADGSLASVVQ